MKKSLFPTLLLLSMLLSACGVKKVDERGYRDTDTAIASIKEGTSTKDDVTAALGTPSTQSDYGGESWYYIETTKESVAFFAPKITDQKVTRINFNDTGVVAKVEHYDLAQSQDIQIVDRVTPTEGHKLGIIEQIVGNLGRFNNAASTTRKPRGG